LNNRMRRPVGRRFHLSRSEFLFCLVLPHAPRLPRDIESVYRRPGRALTFAEKNALAPVSRQSTAAVWEARSAYAD
jgi:hypothetical protein